MLIGGRRAVLRLAVERLDEFRKFGHERRGDERFISAARYGGRGFLKGRVAISGFSFVFEVDHEHHAKFIALVVSLVAECVVENKGFPVFPGLGNAIDYESAAFGNFDAQMGSKDVI